MKHVFWLRNKKNTHFYLEAWVCDESNTYVLNVCKMCIVIKDRYFLQCKGQYFPIQAPFNIPPIHFSPQKVKLYLSEFIAYISQIQSLS